MVDIDIVNEVSSALRQAHTQSLDISLNELLDMKAVGELNISPDYQRLFRWSEGQRSRLVESLLLEMPIPPIFVIEDENNHYELIDGLQRISSYLHLRGQLDALHLEPPVNRGDFLTLTDCDIIPALNGLKWATLPPSLQIRLKRAFIRVEVVRKGADHRFKYHMFKRLNTGGDRLSEQQVRNATIRMLDKTLPDFIVNLSEIDSFRTCTSGLTQERILSSIDQELVLRFFALKNYRDKFKHEVSDFLTEYMEEIAERKVPFDYDGEKKIFLKTFSILSASIGDMAFSFANKRTRKLTNGFGIYHYEALTIGIQPILERLNASDEAQMDKLKGAITQIKLDQNFIAMTTGGGKNSPGPLSERIEFVSEALNREFTQ